MDTTMEGAIGSAPGNPAALKEDSGLDLLFALYSFLHGTVQEAVCRLFIATFSDAQYVKENIGKCVKLDMTLFDFLCHINMTIKNMREDKSSKKSKPKNSPSSFQPSCLNHQQKQQSHHHAYQHRGQQYAAYPHTSQPQAPAKCQQAAPCTASQQNEWPLEIQNVHEKKKMLIKITVGDLLHKKTIVNKDLLELDLNFVLGILLNQLMDFRLEKKVKDALSKMKKVRTTLSHSQYNFSENDFEKNLGYLEEAVGEVHKVLFLPDHLLQDGVNRCRDEVKSGNKARKIIYELMLDIHKQYSRPDPIFVSPTISFSPMHHREVIEDVQKFIETQQDKMDPILLCGKYKEEKTLVFEKLAFEAKNSKRYSLVLYLKDSHRRSYCRRVTSAVQEFQDQLYSCLRILAPNVFYMYGAEAVKTTIRMYQKNILFLINWNVSVWGPVQSEMQQGTWVMACHAKEPPKGGWQILRLEPYSDLQVREVLLRFHNSEDLLRCYESFSSQHILSSWDMIKIFCEVNQTFNCGTDFEVVNTYVSESVRCAGGEAYRVKQDLQTLGELAFNSLCSTKFALAEGKLVGVQECVCDAFLDWIENEGWYFKHSVVRDFLAAKYVVANPSVTCENQIKKDENVTPFMRVFKFACYLLSEGGSRIIEQNLRKMERFLRTLLCVPDKRLQCSEKEARSGNQKSNQKKKMSPEKYENKYKNPFDNWDFLLELDSACTKKILECIVSILADIPCWHFNDIDCLDATKLTRLGRVLNKMTLSKKNPVIIKLNSNANVALLTKLWKMFRGIASLYGCVDVVVTIEGDDADHFNYKDKLEEFLESIANAQVELYISEYKGPLFSLCIPSFFKCMCMHYLKILEVSVYDVKSLCEVMMACRALPSLQEVFIRVNLLLTEQTSFKLAQSVIPIEFSERISVHVTFKYFPQIQYLLDIFERRDRFCSLSIHELYIFAGFKLDLSKYSNLKSLNIRCEPKCSGETPLSAETDRRVVDETERLLRRHWMLPFLNGLTLPDKIERLLLRNVEFIDDSHQSFIILFLEKYNINRLLILDTQLSLTGVGQLLYSQTKVEEDVKHDRERKLRRHESHDIRKLGMKRTRICKEKREAMKWNKPDGKEIVITSEGDLCRNCSCFPCMCPSKVDRDEGCNSFEKMIGVINDMYCCNIQTFSYSFKHCTIRKDLCGDLRVQCIMKCLNDSDILEIESRWCVKRFFLPLLLAQSVSLEETALSPVGVAKVAEHLRYIKGTNQVDPFSLIIETSWHPPHNCSPFTGFKDFLKTAEYLSVVHLRCNCASKCFHVKKTYRGNVEEVIQAH
ncbi:uncharacterized protein LOC123501682 isoform X2 [Portunus trituberculatus]|uniref:uncharacterized protein LOC123501682 isoform X2 n=1 Tax=Portunus trituberculatus TaxID=210409 RepID=UPI001E1CE75F|nr:uncharacterized protein LOC123501682 isoform X2 [Portunus trituberculatus]XP_045106598.1 uncharacterized protein LOC123501682 isoform X2 [Portunus trituberculatus]